MPPHPSKKEERIMLIEIFFNGIVEIVKIPLVISTIPRIKLSTISVGICKKDNKGFINNIKLLCFKIEIITENITIKPPDV